MDDPQVRIVRLLDEIENLENSAKRRTVIGMAMGFVMARCDVDADVASQHLRRICQGEDKRLYDVALEITTSRQLPMALRPDDGHLA